MQSAGDEQRLAELVGRLLDQQGPALALYAAQWTRSPDDCVQEALLALARQHDLPQEPLAWVYKVVRNLAINAARSDRRRSEHEASAWTDRLSQMAGATEAERLELTEALSRLTDEMREVVILKIWGGMTYAEIAQVTGGSTSHLQRRYQQALSTIRTAWGVKCPDEGEAT